LKGFSYTFVVVVIIFSFLFSLTKITTTIILHQSFISRVSVRAHVGRPTMLLCRSEFHIILGKHHCDK